MGVDGLVILGYTFYTLLLVVALGIAVMPIVNRLFEVTVTACLCKQHIAHIVEILTTALEYPNYAGPTSKIMPPCSAQTI